MAETTITAEGGERRLSSPYPLPVRVFLNGQQVIYGVVGTEIVLPYELTTGDIVSIEEFQPSE